MEEQFSGHWLIAEQESLHIIEEQGHWTVLGFYIIVSHFKLLI